MPMSEALKHAQDNYRARNKNKGMMRVNVWVPEGKAGELRALAKQMRAECKPKKGAE